VVKTLHILALASSIAVTTAEAQTSGQPEQIYPGVWRVRLGTPESITPVSSRYYGPATDALGRLPRVDVCPIAAVGVPSPRGFLVTLPLAPSEMARWCTASGFSFSRFSSAG
jgi:alpha-D-xyloside xylohydrolase